MVSDKENRLRLFMADLRALLWQHDASLLVSLEAKERGLFDAALKVEFNFGDSVKLPRIIDGKEPTP